MFRFTIRDVLWLTVVVAMGVGWWIEYRRSPTRQLEFRASALEQAIKGHGFTVEHPSPFRVKVWNRNAIVDVNHEPASQIGDPFRAAPPAADEDPFGPAWSPANENPFGPAPSDHGDPFAPR
jgi:hypothetical protein